MHIRLKATGRCWAVNKLARWQIKLSKANNKPGELSPSQPHCSLCTTELSIIIGRGTKYVCTNWFPMAACLPVCLPACCCCLCDNCILQIFTCCTQFAQWDYAYAWFDFGLSTLCPKIVVDYWVAAVNHRLIGRHAQHSAADHTANPSQRSRGGHSDGNVAVVVVVAVVGSVCWPFA